MSDGGGGGGGGGGDGGDGGGSGGVAGAGGARGGGGHSVYRVGVSRKCVNKVCSRYFEQGVSELHRVIRGK